MLAAHGTHDIRTHNSARARERDRHSANPQHKKRQPAATIKRLSDDSAMEFTQETYPLAKETNKRDLTWLNGDRVMESHVDR